MRVTLTLLLTLLCPNFLVANDWNSWRGPHGTGVTGPSEAPSEFGSDLNVRWKYELPGPGNSSPIVFEDRVWITQFDKENNQRQLRCLNAVTGDELWTASVQSEDDEATHPTNPYCAASPVTDGRYVVAFFGSAGLCCYDLDGNELWRKQLGSPQHLFGQGASPLIHGDLVTLNFGPGTEQFWATFDLETGDERWRLAIDKVDAPNPFDQPDGPKLPPGTKLRDPFGTWATPLLATHGNQQELILAFPKELRAVNPQDGSTLWTCGELGDQILTSPILVGDKVVCLGATALAVRLAGSGDVTETHRLWFEEEDRPRIGTGIGIEGLVIANTMQGGIVEAIDVETGKRQWQKRLTDSDGGGSWSSLVGAGDRIFATNQDGTIYVFKALPEYELIAKNALGEKTNATPAIANGCIYIRTNKHLWCIGT